MLQNRPLGEAISGRVPREAWWPKLHARRARECDISRRRVSLALLLIVTTLTAVGYALEPADSSALLYVAVSVILLCTVIVAPLARRARPYLVWIWVPIGALFLLLELLCQVAEQISGQEIGLGPFSEGAVLIHSGYLSFIIWLSLLCRRAGNPSGWSGQTDPLSVTAGAALAVWVLFVAPLLDGTSLPNYLVRAAIPVYDVILVSLAITLVSRLQLLARGLAWLIGTLVLLLLLDVIALAYELVLHSTSPPWLRAGYLFVYFGIALCSTHPTAVNFWGPKIVRGDPRPVRATALVIFTVSPAVLAIAVPTAGNPVDVVVRSLFACLLLALLFVRLTRTMRALAQAEAESRRRALLDELTGLPNRAAVRDILATRLTRNAVEGRITAVLYLDYDDFKEINDTWGHGAGDRLLTHVARSLPQRLRSQEILARWGGDEFVIVATLEAVKDADEIADRVQQFFSESFFVVAGRSHVARASIGIALAHPGESTTVDALISEADLAMYEAKQRVRGG